MTIIVSALTDGLGVDLVAASTAARPSPRKIANNAGEFDTPAKTGAFIAAGLVLFILTFVVNAIARIVIERRKAFTE